MALSTPELTAAIAAAKVWPVGHGEHWLTTQVFVLLMDVWEWLKDHQSDAQFG
jgi:hypothetical protein